MRRKELLHRPKDFKAILFISESVSFVVFDQVGNLNAALAHCGCDVDVERQVVQMTANGFGPNCIFCSGRLSESLCVASALHE